MQLFSKCGQTMLLAAGISLSAVLSAQAQSKTLFAACTESGTRGHVFKSTDGGKTWKDVWEGEMNQTSPPNAGSSAISGVAYGNGKLVAVGKTLLVSADQGSNWDETYIYNEADNITDFSDVTYEDGLFVAAGKMSAIIYSTDGKKWKYVPGKGSAAVSPAAANNTREEASNVQSTVNDVKNGKIGLGSLKGKLTQAAQSSGGSSSPAGSSAGAGRRGQYPGMNSRLSDAVRFPNRVFFTNGKFYVCGSAQAMEMAIFTRQGNDLVLEKIIDFPSYGMASSTNGVGGLSDMASDGKTIVAVTNTSKSAYSADGGNTWKFLKHPNGKAGGTVVYANGKYVMLNTFGEVFHSPNIAEGWTEVGHVGDKLPTIRKVIFLDGKFIAVAADQKCYTSTDGITWNMVSAKGQIGFFYMDVAAAE